jgi:hypothetical protein
MELACLGLAGTLWLGTDQAVVEVVSHIPCSSSGRFLGNLTFTRRGSGMRSGRLYGSV